MQWIMGAVYFTWLSFFDLWNVCLHPVCVNRVSSCGHVLEDYINFVTNVCMDHRAWGTKNKRGHQLGFITGQFDNENNVKSWFGPWKVKNGN